MKKLFVLMSLLVVAAACTVPPTNTNTTANANTAEQPSAPAMTEADAIAKEKSIWETVKNKDYDGFAGMLANDEMEVTSEGVLEKAGSVAMVRDFEPTELTFSDWKFIPIDKDAWVVTYTVNVKGKYKGKDFPPDTVRGSSAWSYRDGKWVAVYHQESHLMNTPPPPPVPAASPKAAASPAASPATTTTTSDVVADEKMVWDFFKAHQYDAFADLLAPEFIEVEPNGVFDKAGSVKGVQDFDFTKATTTEFKSLNIDADAALVTYLLTMPGAKPEQERHSTIWAKRDAKWLAIFHQGTAVTQPAGSASPGMNASPSPAMMMSPSPK